MMRARPSRMQGLTLVELMLGMALTAMLLFALTSMLQVSSAASSASSEQLDLQEQAQFAVRRIASRIESTPAVNLPDKADDSSSANWLTPAVYDLQPGADPNTKALFETIGPVRTVLAEPVDVFTVTSAPVTAGRNVVDVRLTISAGKSTASAAVSVRLGALL
ncbi:MAG: hypothetical protein JWP59_3151 [Massilia sp.]|nr:hypothetical protein [Massilia sp.]